MKPRNAASRTPAPPPVPDVARVTHDLQERVKELRCLYGIAELSEQHGNQLEPLLQGIAELLPPAWQYPEQTCARVVFHETVYATTNFRKTRWRQASEILVGGRTLGLVEVYYLKKMPDASEGPFLREERALIDAVAERVRRAAERLETEQRLMQAHRDLQLERTSLQEANTALRTILARIEEEKREVKEQILANVTKILLPLLGALAEEVPPNLRRNVELLRRNLEDIAAPFVDRLSKSFLNLTPMETRIANMIKNGLSSKEIAQMHHISPMTVSRHREHIRRKLAITNQKINLATYLQAFEHRLDLDGRSREAAIKATTNATIP